jgi:methylated-DNA-protein-cysteine methyltransferase-like protein
VAAVVRRIPAGTVLTYGEVALEAGLAGAARQVGHVLASSEGLPWWRVVTASGRLVPGLEDDHARRLRAEGVSLSPAGRVPLTRRAGQPVVQASTSTNINSQLHAS